MQELRPPVRHSALPPQQREPYWNLTRVLILFAILTAVPVILAISVLAVGGQVLKQSTAELDRQNEQQLERVNSVMGDAARQFTPLIPPPQKRLVTITDRIPPRSVKECSDATGGVINETWQKCRQGSAVTRQEWQ